MEEDQKQEEDNFKDEKKIMERVQELKDANVGINSTTEALLLIISQDVDRLRFHNTD